MAQPGDRVTVTTKDKTYEGILMPRPPMLLGKATVLKLDSGYNIGIEEGKIELVKKAPTPKKTTHKEVKENKKLPTVSLLSFGGTISSKVDYHTGGTTANYGANDFVDMLPEIHSIANIRAKKVMGVMSENMNPTHWTTMAKEIEKQLKDESVAGVVVTQGTDTLHYSAAAMSFALGKLNKPVVFTAAQRSIDRGSSDAFMNLLCATHAAKSDIAEVMTCMHESMNDDNCILIRGTKVRKMHTSRRDAFRPIGELPLARISTDGTLEIINHNFNKKNTEKVSAQPNFSDKVGMITVYPGMDADQLDHFVKKKYKGVVVSATALGHMPEQTHEKLKPLLADDCVVVIASQTIYGRVHPNVYSNLRTLSLRYGCVFAEDTMPEVAYTKLTWLLANEKNVAKIKEQMQHNLRGEITVRSDYQSFLY